MNTTALIQQLRAALCTAHALLFGSRPHGQADIDMLRAASRQGITTADQWLAEQSAQKPVSPDGWKLVPVESTPEMISAGERAHWNKERDACSPTPTEFSYDGGGPIGYAWTAMLAAAPQAVAQPLTDEQIVSRAMEAGDLDDLCVLVDYDPDTGPVRQRWVPRGSVRRLVNTIVRAHGIGLPAGNRPSTPLHITGSDGRSLRVTRQYWHEGVLCVATEAWPEPRTMTVEDLADCGLLSELDDGAGPS